MDAGIRKSPVPRNSGINQNYKQDAVLPNFGGTPQQAEESKIAPNPRNMVEGVLIFTSNNNAPG